MELVRICETPLSAKRLYTTLKQRRLRATCLNGIVSLTVGYLSPRNKVKLVLEGWKVIDS